MSPPLGALVAVATCAAVPGLDRDGPRLLSALRAAGARPQVDVWDDPGVDWSGYDVVVVRSTWDYTRQREPFLAWARSCRAVVNPWAMLEWNTDKRYLGDLESAGVDVVPTVFRLPGEPLDVPPAWVDEVVVKPAVSASAADTGRYAATDPMAAQLLRGLHADGRVAMVQPYLPAVEEQGETSLVFLAGSFSHAVVRPALLTEHGTRTPSHHDPAPGIEPTPAQLALAEAALGAVPSRCGRPVYARVDLIPGPTGAPLLLELELVEPSLFLDRASDAAMQRFAAAVVGAAR